MASLGDLTTPEFVLRFVDGRGLLGLRVPVGLPLGRFDRLELEIPNLRFPFDGSGEPGRFRNRRCTVREASLRIDEPALAAWIASRPLARFGIDDFRPRIAADHVQLSGAITIGDRRSTFAARLHLAQQRGSRSDARHAVLVVSISHVRVFHALAAPVPLVGLALLYALGARPVDERATEAPPGFALRGIDSMEVEPITVALWRSLVPSGWRLPKTSELDVMRIETTGGVIHIEQSSHAAQNGHVAAAAAGETSVPGSPLADGDELLATGDTANALRHYERAPDDARASERRLAILATDAARFDEAIELGEALLQRDPERATVITLLGAVLAERGVADRAAELFQRAAQLAERDQEPGAVIDATLRAAELLLAVRPREATPLLEQVVAGRPTHALAAALLASRYADEGRAADLLRLEKRRLSHARGQREEARARVRLGAVWLDSEHDPLRARDELERALRLFEGDAHTFRLYARALDQAGETARALETIEQGIAASEDAASRRQDHLFAARLSERLGQTSGALRHAEDLLEETPSDPDGLALIAHLAAAAGRFDEAVQAYERAVAHATDDGARAQLYFDLAQMCAKTEGLRGRVRTFLDRAREAQPSQEILRAAAALAEEEHRSEDLEDLLARLAATGDRDARERRARLLLSMGRAADAAAEAESLATTGDPAALALLVDARRAEGRSELVLGALERLIDVSRSSAPRVELGRLHADAGDLVRARILLEEAVPLAGDDTTSVRAALEVLCDVLMRQGDDPSLEVALGRLAAVRTEPDAKARALAAQGGARVRLGRLDAAMSSYREALAADPSDSQARVGLAETAYALRLWDEARAALEPLYVAAPRADRALRLGEIAERQNRATDAVGFYEAALDAVTSGGDAQRIYVALASIHHARAAWEDEARILLRAAEDARTTDNEGARAGRLVQAADILRKRVGRIDEALPLYDRALLLDAINLPALDALEAIALEREDWQRAAQILSRKVAATAKRPAEQKAILGRLAVLQAERLGREDAAREAYIRALAIDAGFRPALVFLAKDARARGQRGEELERLERLTALPPDPAEPDTLLADLCRLAQLYVDAARTTDAEAIARRVLVEQPRHPAALALLDDIFTRAGRLSELEAVLAVRAQIETDHDAGVEIMVRRAALLEGTDRIAEAIATYEQITAIRPTHVLGWTRLADLLRKTSAWAPLATVLGRLADWHWAGGRREEASGLYVEQAHVLHDHLGEGDRARAVLERAKDAWPSSRLVIGALLALARGRGDAADEAALLDQLILLEPDPAARGSAVLDRARADLARGDGAAALRRLRELRLADAPLAALRMRVELEAQLGAPASAIDEIEALRRQAAAAGDVALERFALGQLLVVARAEDPSRAEALAAEINALDPDDREALRVLADAAKARGDDLLRTQLLERLRSSHRRGLGGRGADGAIALELGLIAVARGDLSVAEAYLREAIDAEGELADAHRELGRLLAQGGMDTEAAHHLVRAAELDALSHVDYLLLADVHERLGQVEAAARSLMRASDAAPPVRRALAASRLGDEAEARRAALAALALDADSREALAVLLRGLSAAATFAQIEDLASTIGAERAARLLVDRVSSAEPADARLALERAIALAPTAERWMALGALLDGEAAAAAYSAALALEPGSAEAALARSASADPATAIEVLSAALDDSAASPLGRARLALRIGELELERADLRSARNALARAMEDAAIAQRAEDPEQARAGRQLGVRAARALAGAARAAGDSHAAEQALLALIESASANDADLRQLAELRVERGAYADAIEILEELPSPGDLMAVALERAGDSSRLVAHLVRDAAERPSLEARRLLFRAATISLDVLHDPRRAADLLERAIPLGPSDPELWERLGKIRRDKLQDPDGASHAFARAYANDPSRTHLLLFLADFHDSAAESAPANDYYLSLLAAGVCPPEALPRVHLRLAHYARLRADAIEEEQHLRRSVELAPSVEAWRRLVDIYRVREDRLRLEQALLGLADLVNPSERLPLLREARELEGPAPHAELDERILALDRTDAPARTRVFERLRRAEDPTVLLDRLEREVESVLAAQGTSIGPDLPLELGRVSLERGDYARAARGFRLAAAHGGGLAAAEGSIDALRALGRLPEAATLTDEILRSQLSDHDRAAIERLLLDLYLELGSDRALPLIEAARQRGVELPVEGSAYRGLLRAEGRMDELLLELDGAIAKAPPDQALELSLEAVALLDGPMRRPRDAARRLAALFDQHPTREELAVRARALYLAVDEPIYALSVLDKQLARADAESMPELKITRGEILLAAGADAEAEAEFLHALITTKRVGRAHAALAGVYRKRGDLASALEHLIAAADAPDLEPARAAACAVDAADVLLVEGDNATAERLYQLAAALDPADRRALDALIRLAAAQAAYERQAELLGRAATLTADRRERARLLHERARLFENELGRDLDAYRAYREAVACDPTLREAVRSLRVLAEARGEWAIAAEQLYREASLTEDAVERARIHLHLARTHEERLFDTAAALRNLEQAAELLGDGPMEPADSPWPGLVRLYMEEQRLADAAAAADRWVASLPDDTQGEVRIEALERAAALHQRAGTTTRAEAHLEEAQRLGRRGSAGLEDPPPGTTPEEHRRMLEERLAATPDGERRLALLRRLVALLTTQKDLAELDARSLELLKAAPDDAVAFGARRTVLEARRDTPALIALLRARASAASDPRERAERRFEAGHIAESLLHDVPGAAADYEAALDADPDHVAALDASADLAFRTRHLQRARALYERLGDRSTLLSADEVARRRGELAEEAADFDAARRGYREAVAHNPDNLFAQQSLARVCIQLEDDRGAYHALRAVLELLPRDALDRSSELRQHLGELAARLGELADARTLLESILLEDPRRRDALTALTDVYERSAAWNEAAELYERRSILSDRNDERADLLFAQGEALLRAGDRERASDAYLKSADLNPRHAPTLRRLVRHYLGEGDLEALQEVVAEIEALGAPLAEAAIDAGLGLALRGDEARGAIVAAMAQPSPETIVDAIASLPWPPTPAFDAAIRTAQRAAGGTAPTRERLLPALEDRAQGGFGSLSARYAVAVLRQLAGQTAHARLQLEILSFFSPLPIIDARLAQLGAVQPPEPTADQVVAPEARGPLRDALCDLGPLCLGLAVAPLDVDSSPAATALVAPVATLFGYESMDVALLDRLADPAWAEPTRPPRLLLQRRFAADAPVARFAAARALHALHAGLGLIHGRSIEDVQAFFRAAAGLFLPDLRADGPFIRAWQAELVALGLRPEVVNEATRTRLEISLANLVVDRAASEHADAYAAAERLTANRVAYIVTGDLRAGLVALCPAGFDDAAARQRALRDDPALSDLVAFALMLTR